MLKFQTDERKSLSLCMSLECLSIFSLTEQCWHMTWCWQIWWKTKASCLLDPLKFLCSENRSNLLFILCWMLALSRTRNLEFLFVLMLSLPTLLHMVHLFFFFWGTRINFHINFSWWGVLRWELLKIDMIAQFDWVLSGQYLKTQTSFIAYLLCSLCKLDQVLDDISRESWTIQGMSMLQNISKFHCTYSSLCHGRK